MKVYCPGVGLTFFTPASEKQKENLGIDSKTVLITLSTASV
jgi:hypothetical protein